MKILVLMKQTYDTEAKISLNGSGEIQAEGAANIINPYCEFAVEEAIRIVEKTGSGEITILSVGTEDSVESVRVALAMGADKAVLIDKSELGNIDEYTTAKLLAKAAEGIEYDIILGGMKAIDDGSGQVAIRVAELLDIPHVNMVTKLEISGSSLTATREIEGGSEIVELATPAIITAQKGLNEPRYPALKNIMKAKKKELKVVKLSDLGFTGEEVAAKMIVDSYSLPQPRQAGQKIEEATPQESAKKLVSLLREQAKVI
ncbi:MAG: electron transfer flavoprotein subunit beta/FixA family protein [Bacillota bacterium]|nr:electron transfer flavoprotein subunit beta/FixA family protein [Bacillota bacterium]